MIPPWYASLVLAVRAVYLNAADSALPPAFHQLLHDVVLSMVVVQSLSTHRQIRSVPQSGIARYVSAFAVGGGAETRTDLVNSP